MKKITTILVFLGILLCSSMAIADSSCLSNPNTRNNYYNTRRQADNLTNYNNQQRMENSNGPEWVRRQEQQNYRLHQYKREHSDFTEKHWNN